MAGPLNLLSDAADELVMAERLLRAAADVLARDRLLCAKELAERWRVDPETIYKWRDAGTLPPPMVMPDGRSLRWRLDVVMRFESDQIRSS